MTTILYFVRAGDNEELRYSLRSLVNIPHDRVVIVGDKPDWVTGVEYHPGNRQIDKWRNVHDNLRIACRKVPGEWVVMNDDFFILEPVSDAPAWCRGLLADHIARVSPPTGAWYRSLSTTFDLLVEMGIEHPLSYDLHVPVRMDSERLAEVLRIGADRPDLPQWRTMYGNYWQVPAEVAHDVRITKPNAGLPSRPFASTNDPLWLTSVAGQQLRAMFPDPSPYEAHSEVKAQ